MGATPLCTSIGVLLCILHAGLGELQPINITFGDVTQVVMFEGQDEIINVSVVSYDGDGTVSIFFDSENSYTFEVMNQTFVRLEINNDSHFPVTAQVTLKGRHIGISNLRVFMSAVGSTNSTQFASLIVKVNVGNFLIQGILQYIFYIPLVCLFFMMGASMDLEEIAICFKHPIPIFVGFFCQFVVMPALSLGIVKMFGLDTGYALGLLLLGCCPGGKISNDLTILLDADYTLSVTMTACSTALALATMPLNIFIYTRFLIQSENIETPYGQIAMQIAILMTPILLGILLKYKLPSIKDKVLKILKPIVAVVMLASAGLLIPFTLYIFLSPLYVYLAASLLPVCGAFLGGFIAKLLQLPNDKVVAISMETGVQNGLFAIVVLRAVYPSPEADLATSAPTLSFLSMLLFGIALVIGKIVYTRFVNRKQGEDTENIIKVESDDQDKGKEENGKAIVLTSVNTLDEDQVLCENNNNLGGIGFPGRNGGGDSGGDGVGDGGDGGGGGCDGSDGGGDSGD
nr:ileal sodium/bile acid cotransporter-like [Lytechinus pictus]